MTDSLIAALIGTGGFLTGVGLTLLVAHRRPPAHPTPAPLDLPSLPRPPIGDTREAPRGDRETAGALYPVALLADALRAPLLRLRRLEGIPAEVIRCFERVAWQARMLTSRGRPMQTRPQAPITLLQHAAEEVELLRLGKVAASWKLLTRQPVHLDAERSRAAFREILAAGCERVGEGGRIGIRICEGEEPGFPVRVEIEIGKRGAEPDALAFLVAKHLLESQGARIQQRGRVTRIELHSLVAGCSDEVAEGDPEAAGEIAEDRPQTPSKR